MSTEITTTKEHITPEIAQEYLDSSVINRKIKRSLLNQLKRAFLAGEFLDVGDPLRFNEEGRLFDGQHRLTACYETGVPFDVTVIKGLNQEQSRFVIDSGAPRSFSDILGMENYDYPNDTAACVNRCVQYLNRKVGNDRKDTFSAKELWDWLHANLGMIESVRFARKHRKYLAPLPVSIISSLHYLFAMGNGLDAADKFFLQIAYIGEEQVDLTSEQRGTLNTYRTWLTNTGIELQHGKRITEVKKTAITIKAFNAWMEGVELKQMRWSPGGPNPEKFPEIFNLPQGGIITDA